MCRTNEIRYRAIKLKYVSLIENAETLRKFYRFNSFFFFFKLKQQKIYKSQCLMVEAIRYRPQPFQKQNKVAIVVILTKMARLILQLYWIASVKKMQGVSEQKE